MKPKPKKYNSHLEIHVFGQKSALEMIAPHKQIYEDEKISVSDELKEEVGKIIFYITPDDEVEEAMLKLLLLKEKQDADNFIQD